MKQKTNTDTPLKKNSSKGQKAALNESEQENDLKQQETTKERSLFSLIAELVLLVGAALALAWAITTFVITPYIVPTGSMIPTIQEKERIFSEQVSYWFSEPAQGDIITFDDPATENRTLVKRIVAVAGQTVDLKDGSLYVDGELYDEYTTEVTVALKTMSGVSISYPYTVPEGHVFVMGDNRTNSADSRYFGPVATSDITGHVFFVYWPFSAIRFLD